MVDLDALGAADDEAVIFASKRKLDALVAELRAARAVVGASKKRREEQSHWFGPDFFMPDKPLVEQAFLNACRDEDAALAEYEALSARISRVRR